MHSLARIGKAFEVAIPAVDLSALQSAMNEFDSTLRESSEWAHWEDNKAQVWVLNHQGRRYPPKKIVSMATGLLVSQFSGGPETNDYLASRGLTVGKLREISLSETFELILERYSAARASQAFAGSHEIRELFTQARRLLEQWEPVARRKHLHVVASYGKGNWATIPWISILDDRETKTTQSGTYVVYLFREDGAGVQVKIAQGVTVLEKELGVEALRVLAERAAELRGQCTGLGTLGFDLTGKSDLGSTTRQGRLYEASSVASKHYAAGSVPSDAQLKADLSALLDAYERLVDSRPPSAREASGDARPLALLGSWRGATREVGDVGRSVQEVGGWASWWSFVVKPEAQSRLNCPFHLYAYDGDSKQLVARLRVDEMATSRGNAGIECPWPSLTKPEWRDVTRAGPSNAEVFKTWFRIGAVEPLRPPRGIDSFELALGLSTPESAINQNAFGYLIDDEAPMEANELVATEPPPAAVAPVPVAPALLPALPIDWLVERTGMDSEFLQEVVDALLGGSPQIMLAGPPGTSKTWVARQLATFITRNRPDATRLVQFHPSFSYESFIEGLRPVTKASGIAFELTPGVVIETVRRMHQLRLQNIDEQQFAIVIDEANRANLPRVLGELMYLFEYRNESIQLQYSGAFSLPRNLRFIATMNTADRSIRSIDVALRRRFDVFEMGPSAKQLETYIARTGATAIAGLVDGFSRLNQELETHLDRHHTIGHAFFMRPRIDERAVQEIWRRRVFPLIEEFFFDQPAIAKEFSLGRFWPAADNGA